MNLRDVPLHALRAFENCIATACQVSPLGGLWITRPGLGTLRSGKIESETGRS